ncbi:MAG TPA: hypothetical protein VEC08_03635 [Nitrososphaerales archaeon]|nr:hypothetical protein [Nitrososphaerales archaeon]
MKTVRESCEPVIEPRFREYRLDGLPILAVEIPIGRDKPYTMKQGNRKVLDRV